MESVFHSMRLCGVLMDFDANVLDVNPSAVSFYKAQSKQHVMNYHSFDFTINKDKAKYLLHKIITEKELSEQSILLRRFDNTIASVNMSAFVLPDKEETIFVQFNENIEPCIQYQTNPFDIALLANVQKLKPFLNKAGQNLLRSISEKHQTEYNEIFYERMKILVQLYPELSSNELTLCVYFSLSLNMSAISSILGKTPNSIRVTIHRIAQKLNTTSRTHLFQKLAKVSYS